MANLERDFQAKLIKRLYKEFDGCLVMKNDSGYIQGIPDLTILFKDRWAMLECKKNKNSSKRPNQTHFVERMNNMSYANFICPETEEGIVNELREHFESKR